MSHFFPLNFAQKRATKNARDDPISIWEKIVNFTATMVDSLDGASSSLGPHKKYCHAAMFKWLEPEDNFSHHVGGS